MNSQFDKYRHHIAEMQLTPKEEDELLAAIWAIVEHFVDVGLGFGAIQSVLEGSEQDSGNDPRIEVGSCPSSDNKHTKRDRDPS